MEKKKLEEKYGKEIVEIVRKYLDLKKGDFKDFDKDDEKVFEDVIKRRIGIRNYKNQIVKCIDERGTPFKKGKEYLCLGEIKNMEEHIIIVDDEGKIQWAYHPEHFKIVKDNVTTITIKD